MKFNILKVQKFSFIISSIAVIASIGILIAFGLKPGIDFVGGSLMEVTFSSEESVPDIEAVRTAVNELSLEGSAQVQLAGEDGMLLRLPFVSEEQHQQVLDTLNEKFGSEESPIEEERFETIGPAISAQLRQRTISITFAVIIAIVLFVAYAFRKVSKPLSSWKYGAAAIVALVHDLIITLAIFSLLGYFFGVEVDIPFIVALMTILGYSVNDTIVVFDRIRENLLKWGASRFDDAVVYGVQDTITRSINTSFTTLLVLGALFLFGGASIHYFSLALIVGIILGTYSSIFLASPLLVVWNNYTKKAKKSTKK